MLTTYNSGFSMMTSNRFRLFIGFCVIGQLTGCAQNGAKQDDFESLFLDYCRNEGGPEKWHRLKTSPDLNTKREFLAKQIRDVSNESCQIDAMSLYAKVPTWEDSASIFRSIALNLNGKNASASTQIFTDRKIRSELRFFLAEKHPSKWPLLTQLLESKQTKDLKSFERYVAIAKQRIKKGDFSAEDVRSLESRF